MVTSPQQASARVEGCQRSLPSAHAGAPELLAHAAADVRRSGPRLQVVPASSRQCSLQRIRPLVVSLGQSPYLVRSQAKISKNRPERLTCVDGVQEPLPHLYRKLRLRPAPEPCLADEVSNDGSNLTSATVGPRTGHAGRFPQVVDNFRRSLVV